MKSRLGACVVAVVAMSSTETFAQNRVSVELSGTVAASDLNLAPSSPSSSQSAIRTPDSVSSQMMVNSQSLPADGIAVFEVRPTIMLDSGLVVGVGFRTGKAGLGDNSTSLVGGDVALGFQHRFGAFVPFIKGMFGFNTYETLASYDQHQTQLRLDAVLGTRLYVSRKLFLTASAFAGWGDRYGGSLGVGGDIVQFFRRGVLP